MYLLTVVCGVKIRISVRCNIFPTKVEVNLLAGCHEILFISLEIYLICHTHTYILHSNVLQSVEFQEEILFSYLVISLLLDIYLKTVQDPKQYV